MKRHHAIALLTLLSVLACLCIGSGCAKKPEDKLVGRWIYDEIDYVMEFRKDGTARVNALGEAEYENGTWTLTDNRTIRLVETGHYGESVEVWNFEVGDKYLTMAQYDKVLTLRHLE